jgi:hypothetical protein
MLIPTTSLVTRPIPGSHEGLNLQRSQGVAAAYLEARHSSKLVRGQQGSFNTRTNLCEGGFSGSGKIISKGRKTAIVGRSEQFQRYEFRRFQHTLSDLLGSLNFWIDGIDYPDKYASWRVQVLANNPENVPSIRLACELHVKVADV